MRGFFLVSIFDLLEILDAVKVIPSLYKEVLWMNCLDSYRLVSRPAL